MSETIERERTLPKGAFAAEIGVSAGRVSQMIAEGKIGADALAGEGRLARIIVDRAKRQIALRRDPGQASGNGSSTLLDASDQRMLDEPSKPDGPTPLAVVSDSFDARYKQEKLEAIRRQNRKATEEEAARKGRFVEADASRTEMTRIAASMMSSFDGALQGFSTVVAARFGVPQRDVLHLMRSEFRGFRDAEARRQRDRAGLLPDTVESIVINGDHPS